MGPLIVVETLLCLKGAVNKRKATRTV